MLLRQPGDLLLGLYNNEHQERDIIKEKTPTVYFLCLL